MTVQELIDELNKVEDKSKPIRLRGIEFVKKLKEHIGCIDIY